MGVGRPNLPSIQNPGSSPERFEHACDTQLHIKQTRERERDIFALQPFQHRWALALSPSSISVNEHPTWRAGTKRSSQPSILCISTIDASSPAMLRYLLP